RYIKWAPLASGISLSDEAARLRWAGYFASVPRVLDQGAGDDGSWLMTTALPGQNAVSERWRADPERAAMAIGRGLRALHDALPVDDCPFPWSADDRLAVVRHIVRRGGVDPTRWHPDHHGLSLDQALAELVTVPPVDLLVVCHGDACAPTTILSEDGLV